MKRGGQVVALDVSLMHKANSGIDLTRIQLGPVHYAGQLARYIRDASTIRARTLSEWGRAPTLDECRAMIEQAQAERQRYADESARLCEHDADAADFVPRATTRAIRDQRRANQAAMLEKIKVKSEPLPANDQFRTERPELISEVIACAAEGMGVSVDDLLSDIRKGDVLKARQVACHVMRQRGLSLPQIAERLNRDHSSVINAIKRFDSHATDRMRQLADMLIGKQQDAGANDEVAA